MGEAATSPTTIMYAGQRVFMASPLRQTVTVTAFENIDELGASQTVIDFDLDRMRALSVARTVNRPVLDGELARLQRDRGCVTLSGAAVHCVVGRLHAGELVDRGERQHVARQ